jgi:hypothetical protein
MSWRESLRSWTKRGYQVVACGRAVLLQHRDSKAAVELLSVSEFGGVGMEKKEREELAEEMKHKIEEELK